MSMSISNRSGFQGHPFHLVSPSPWPIYTCISLLTLTTSGVSTMHSFLYASYSLFFGIVLVVYTIFLWFRDVISQGTYLGDHTLAVQRGSNIGVDLVFRLSLTLSHFYMKLTLRFIFNLVLKSVMIRCGLFIFTGVLLHLRFLSPLAVSVIILGVFAMYYLFMLWTLLWNMSLFEAVIYMILLFVFVSGLWFVFGLVFYFLGLELSLFAVVFMSDNGTTGSNNGSGPAGDSGGNSSGGGSPGGGSEGNFSDHHHNPDDDLEQDDIPDVNPFVGCEHVGHWTVDMASTHEDRMSHMCDFGAPEHPAVNPAGEDYLYCTNCHAMICADCLDPGYNTGEESNDSSSSESNGSPDSTNRS